MIEIRKTIILRETVFSELGVEANRPITRAVGMAVIRNPFAEQFIEDLRPLFEARAMLGARQLGGEVGAALDKRRFRANVYLDLGTAPGFGENACVGHKVQIGPKVVVCVLERDPRCQMITLDPDTANPNPEILRTVARGHDGTAGVYGAVLAEGIIRSGDAVEILD